MSETNRKTKSNPAIACGDMKVNGEKIILDQANYGPSRSEINGLAGMEIKMEDATVTNETPDGRIAVKSSSGEIIGYVDGDGTLKRKLDQRDRKDRNTARDTDR